MTARILIIDDLRSNIALLEAKLVSNYYEVRSAFSAAEGLKIVEDWHPDLILLDVMMPIMDGFEVCKILKANHHFLHIPIVMVTALNDADSKLKGLTCGADDFLSKPINDVALFARIRSLLRLKIVNDELRLRYTTISQLDDSLGSKLLDTINDMNEVKILVIEDDIVQAGQIRSKMKTKSFETILCQDPEEAFQIATEIIPDLIIIDLQLIGSAGLKVCSQLRSEINTRYTSILMIVDESDESSGDLLNRGIEIGINDYISVPLDGNELLARTISQIKRKRYQDALKQQMQDDVQMSILDPLTACYNRRYFDLHIKNAIHESQHTNGAFCLAILDLDHFKKINDTHGHLEGDSILKILVSMLQVDIRASDLLARYGGEEFVILMPQTTEEEAFQVCERLRLFIEKTPLGIAGGKTINITISVGIACLIHGEDSESIISRTDQALYKAKNTTRNKVVLAEKS